jgi:hypothetical protein
VVHTKPELAPVQVITILINRPFHSQTLTLLLLALQLDKSVDSIRFVHTVKLHDRGALLLLTLGGSSNGCRPLRLLLVWVHYLTTDPRLLPGRLLLLLPLLGAGFYRTTLPTACRTDPALFGYLHHLQQVLQLIELLLWVTGPYLG